MSPSCTRAVGPDRPHRRPGARCSMAVGGTQFADDSLGVLGEPSRQRRQDRNARSSEACGPCLLAGVVLRAEVPCKGIDLPGERYVVEPGVCDAQRPATCVVHRRVPPRLGEPGASPHRPCGPFGRRSRPSADVPEDSSWDSRASALGFFHLAPELTDRAKAALHGVGEQLGCVTRCREPTGPVDERPRHRRQRYAGTDDRGWQAMRAFDDDVAGARGLLVVGNEHVHESVGPRPAAHPVPARRFEAGDDGVWPGVEQARHDELIRGRLPAGQQDGAGQQELPRSVRLQQGDTPPIESERCHPAAMAPSPPSLPPAALPGTVGNMGWRFAGAKGRA